MDDTKQSKTWDEVRSERERELERVAHATEEFEKTAQAQRRAKAKPLQELLAPKASQGNGNANGRENDDGFEKIFRDVADRISNFESEQ